MVDAKQIKASGDRAQFFKFWAFIGGIVLAAVFLWLLGVLAPVVLFLCVGMLLAFICSPIVNCFERHKVNRGLGSFIALCIVIAVLGLLLMWLGPLFWDQMVELLSRVPSYLSQIQTWLQGLFNQMQVVVSPDIMKQLQDVINASSKVLADSSADMLAAISNGILPNIVNFMSGAFVSFLGVVLAFWLAKDYPTMVREMATIAGPKHQNSMTLILEIASRSMSGYMKGIVATSVFDGVLVFFGFLLCGQPYAPLMAILTAILHFIPVIGPFFSAAIATVTAIFVSPACAFWTLVVAIVAENITDNVLSPVVMQSAVKVHPAMSLLAIVIGYALGGAVGMAISIPLSAAIKGVFVYYFEAKTERQLVSPDGALFQGRAYVYKDGKPAPSFDALDNDDFYHNSKLVLASEVKEMAKERKELKKPSGAKRDKTSTKKK